MTLRDYQFDAVRAVLWSLATKPEANPCAVLPTGAGKSVVLAEVARTAVQEWRGRVLVVAHVKELLEQNAAKIRALCPGVPVGIHSAGLGRRDTDEPIVVAGVQSAVRRLDEFGKIDLVIVDEAHLIKPAEEDGMYRKLLSSLAETNPRLRVAGFTATPFRLDGGLICGEGKILTEVCYEIGVRALIDGGWLSPLTSRTHDAGAKLEGLHLRGGEFVAEEAAEAMGARGVVLETVRDVAKRTADRKSVLVFCSGVDHAREMAGRLAEFGESAVLTGETPAAERAEILRRFRGETARDLFGSETEKPLKYLCNVGVLTTGFDAPNCDCVVLARATMSTGLYVQMVGRGFRLSPDTGKQNCVAEGTEILTDRGLVPVEKVTKEMKLWDGVEFVRHDGAVCRGEQNAIEYAGLVATRDHKVWCGSEWRAFGECAELGLPISCAGIEGTAIREADHCFRYGAGGSQARQAQQLVQVRSDAVPVRHSRMEVSGQRIEGRCGLSVVRTPEARAEMARQQGDQCEGSLRKSKEQDVQEIRRSRHSFLFPRTNRDGCVDHGEFGELVRQNEADRPNRQQRKLRAWEPANGNRAAEHIESSFSSDTCGDAVPATASGSPIRGCDPVSPDWSRTDGRGDRREVSTAFVQTKRRVWDILNAGPRHRFTANGLLVSNCLVLDYADNILRHGPVDAIDIRKGTGPRETWRRCPKCEAPVPRGAEACPECGAEMPRQERGPREMAGGVYGAASGASILADEGFADVAEVKGEFWERHEKRLKKGDAPKPPTVQITYYIGPNRNYREWLCVEHPARSFPRNKFESWWKKHAPGAPVPATCEEAVALFDAGWTRAVRQVTVERKPGEKYVSVVDWALDAKTRRELAPETYAALENPEPTAERGDAWEGDDPATPAAQAQAAPADPWDADEDNLPF